MAGDVEELLAGISPLRGAGAAISRGRALVGERTNDFGGIVLDFVGSGQTGYRQRGIHHPERANVSTLIADDPPTQSEDGAIRLERQFKIECHLAGVDAAKQVLPAILDPFDWPVEAHRGERNQHILGIKIALDAETAADIRQDASDAPLVDAERGRGQSPRRMRPLTRCPDGQFPADRIRARQNAAGFHRHARVALHPKPIAHHVIGVDERCLHIAEALRPACRNISGCGNMQQLRLSRDCLLGIGQRRQWLIVDDGGFERFLRMGAIPGHHDCHRLPDIPHDIASKRILWARQQRWDPDQNRDCRRALPNIAEAKSVDHTGRRTNGAQIDVANSRVSVRATQYSGVQNSRHAQVVDETPLAAQKTGVLEPRDPRPHHLCAHYSTLQQRPAFAIALRMSKGGRTHCIIKSAEGHRPGGRRPASAWRPFCPLGSSLWSPCGPRSLLE